MTPRDPAPFFVGYLKIPAALRGFLMVASAVLVGGLAGLAFAIGAGVDDPGDGRFAGRRMLTGVIEAAPYPLLRLPPDENGQPRAILLSGQGKRGMQEKAGELDGQSAKARGALLKRGSIEMLQVGGPLARPRLEPADLAFMPAEPVLLGRWRLTGEICDGKCYAGAMRPGTGLSHKACANFCIMGGLPPVFVSTGAVEGTTFFLLADENGGALPDDLYDLTALMIEVEGEIERRDDLLILKTDLKKATTR